MTLHLNNRELYESQGMEDGSDSGTLTATCTVSTPCASTPNNGGIDMANFPTTDNQAPATPPKINGESVLEQLPSEPRSATSSPTQPPLPPDSPLPPELELQVFAPTSETTNDRLMSPCSLQGNALEEDIQSRLEDMITAVTVNEDKDDEDEESSSGCDQLVIDEEVKPTRRKRAKPQNVTCQPPLLSPMVENSEALVEHQVVIGQENAAPVEDSHTNGKAQFNNIDAMNHIVEKGIQQKLSEQYMHTNPYFAESIFELTNHYNTSQVSEGIPKLSLKKIGNRYAKKVRGKNGTPKLREYAQYLGLQPTVQFKCSKCGSAGFESLQLLNEHLVNCTAIAPMHPPPTPSSNTGTNFKVTRKVFLCSACGTYYENWNLFLHMREVHKRFICLYCLGMFPHADKLAAHLMHKHNCTPAKHVGEAEFADAHREPCFLMCCDCQMVFTEQDCVTRHKCIGEDDAKASERVPVGGQDVQVTTNKLVIETSATKDGELSVTGTVEVASDGSQQQQQKEQHAGVVSDGDMSADMRCGDDSESEHENVPEQALLVSGTKCDLDEGLQTKESEDEQHDGEDLQCGEQDDYESDNEENDDNEKDEHPGEKMEVDVCDDLTTSEKTPSWLKEAHEERKVPKVTLKLARMYASGDESHQSDNDMDNQSEDEVSDDSEKHTTDNEGSQAKPLTDDSKERHSFQDNSEVDVEGNTSQEEQDQASNQKNQSEDKLFGNNSLENENVSMSLDEDDVEKSETDCNIKSLDEHADSSQETQIYQEVNAMPLYVTAGSDIAINEIELDQPLDKFDIKLLLQKCLQATIPVCLYCNHARKIAVNGKQLGLHAIAEHRYSSVVKSITAEELIPESFNNRIQESLDELDLMYFTLEELTGGVTFTHLFECFQCRYSSTVHKELFMHNRKLHAKALLLCTMCKTSFYSYSELLCHLCPGVYSSDRDRDVLYRCCMCVSDDLPSAFRLVVHLRKKHHACDVCLEICHNQMRLSNHVWKHKLHHLCYRCGIAYRNKPDITKHLFWKHGTESLQCKKCLQKKWPHVYHFCQPPVSFTCEECNVSLSTAIKLKVHKRLHTNEFPHLCPEDECSEKFISKRLLAKHDKKVHREPEESIKQEEEHDAEEIMVEDSVKEESLKSEEPKTETDEIKEEKEEKPKPKVDVYDLPELNLSESDSDSDEDESTKSTTIFKPENDLSSSILVNTDDLILETTQDDILKLPDDLDLMSSGDVSRDARPVPSPETDNAVLDIWNNFKTYQENIAKTILSEVSKDDDDFPEILTYIPPVLTLEEALRDHDYCPRTTDVLIEQEPIPGLQPVVAHQSPTKTADHDYCTGSRDVKEVAGTDQLGVLPSSKMTVFDEPEVVKTEDKADKNSSDSSSDSDSSSCTCGSNCSCSSGSSSSSSSDSSESDSSSEEGRRRQQVRREKRRGRKPKSQVENVPPSVVKSNKIDHERLVEEQIEMKAVGSRPAISKPPVEEKAAPIRDSDLSTTESDTDEEFYDKEPQKIANKLLAEKREKLMQLAAVGTYINGTLIDSRPTTPSMPDENSIFQGSTVQKHRSPEKMAKKLKKSKSKKKKKKKSSKRESRMLGSLETSYRQHPQVAPLTLSLSKCTPITPVYNSPLNNSNHIPINNTSMMQTPILTDNENSSTRASKRRRVPNKFYGYSSDEENEKVVATGAPNIKFRKVDLPSPKPHLVVPPITIKTTPVVDPISIRMSLNPKEMKVQPLRLPVPKRRRSTAKTKQRRSRPQPQLQMQQTHQQQHPAPHGYPQTPPMRSPAALQPTRSVQFNRAKVHSGAPPPPPVYRHDDYENDSNSSTSDADEEPMPKPLPHAPPHAPPIAKPNAPTAALYCYCKCPYDEVSEMIGCDSDECAIEWFHFECVGIMVPPKGQWFCPDCRKKKQQRREILQQAQVK